MSRLDEITAGASVRGLSPAGVAKVVSVQWYGDDAVKVVYEDGEGTPSVSQGAGSPKE